MQLDEDLILDLRVRERPEAIHSEARYRPKANFVKGNLLPGFVHCPCSLHNLSEQQEQRTHL